MESWYSSCTVLTILMTLHVHCVLFVNGSELKGYLSRECVEVQSVLDIFSGGDRHTQMDAIENNTAISCLERCKKIKLGIAGVQNNRCYCGDHVNIGNKGRCNTKCPGDKTEVCGGVNSTSVIFTSASQPDGYVGCYPDDSRILILGQRYARNSGKYCIRYCMSRSYRYAGTKTKECKCGNSSITGDKTEAACTIRCPGNLEEICGSKNRISLYDTSIVAAKLTTATTSKVIMQTTRISHKTTTLLQPRQSDITISTSTRKGKVINATNKTTTTATTTTSSSSKSRTTETQRPKWSKASQKMSHASYPTEAGSTDVFTIESITSVKDKTEASSTSTSSVADTDGDTTTAMAALYISLPVVITAAGVTLLVVCFISRRRRKQLKSEPRVKDNGNPSKNRCQNSGNGTNLESNDLPRKSNPYNVIPNTSQYVEGTAESRKSEDNMCDDYSTIFIDRGNTLESQPYGNFKTKPFCSKSTCAIYSHSQIAHKSPMISQANNTYSHFGACTLLEQPKRIADETDNTYNVLKSDQCTNMANKASNGLDDEESVYDKAIIGRKHHVINDINDEYALLKRA